ncbi:cobalamin-dependent protein [Paenibacillus abyssi]|uniref:B12-binding domain-containing protein n=1 Tax=Paenibacillus abyssi TaxID=1340531 RepID=A0A917G4X6_9BACL|nr:cobalamin-dependent protein [Paenibacillus abyssi]GGG22872.1 hypothetical protein GCM10010916_44400 [Paenibacillus abyssi]
MPIKQDLPDVGNALLSRIDEMTERVTEIQYQLQPDLHERFGPRGLEKTKQDTRYNLRYLAQSVQIQSPLLFASYMTWLKVLLAGYRVTTKDLQVNLECIIQVMQERLPTEIFEMVKPYMDQAIAQVKEPVEPVPSFLEQSELKEEAQVYTELVLKGDRYGASGLIMELVRNGVPVESIYLQIFQQAQYEIGRLWQANKISVAQEHYFTAATQMIMSQLYPYIFTTASKGHKLVAACIGEELHEIGLRMVSDIFEMNGWDTYYIGANVPSASIIRTINELEADILAISVTMTYHVHLVAKMIEEIRSSKAGARVRILVGGMPFNIDQKLWETVGADGYAPDAKTAIETAYILLGNRTISENL